MNCCRVGSHASDSLDRPALGWNRFERAVLEAGRPVRLTGRDCRATSVMEFVVAHPFAALRSKVLTALQNKPPDIRLNDQDLRGYKHDQPGWIASRIACLATAVEITQIAAHRKPMFPQARPFVEKADCTQNLILSLRRHSQSHRSLPDAP